MTGRVVLEGEVLEALRPARRLPLVGPWAVTGEAVVVCRCGHDLELHTYRCEGRPCSCSGLRPVGTWVRQVRSVLVFELLEEVGS